MKRSGKEYINLLPAREDSKAGRPISKILLLIMVFTLAWAGILGWQSYSIGELKKQTGAIAAKRQQFDQEAAALRQALGITDSGTDTFAVINTVLKERVPWSSVFKEFSNIVPQGLWFDLLEGSAGDRREIRIKGGAFNYRSITEFMVAMEKSGFFQNPQLSYAQKVMVQGREVVGFEILCILKKNDGGSDGR